MLAANRVPAVNKLLATLPRKDYQRVRSGLEPVALTFGQVLYEPEDPIRHVYFPLDSLVSLLTLADGHLALEVGMVGCEGMVGTPLPLGITVSPVRALVQGSGGALRMTSARFLHEFRHCPALQRVLYRYVHVLMAQVTQTAACNRFHVVEKRLARWLLMTLDRVREKRFRLTQEFLSHMISYSRGSITILDRAGLESYACGCYRAVKDTYERILP
jgi:CRP-like cAMP-binding protein